LFRALNHKMQIIHLYFLFFIG